ncbi:MAG TPA: ABC transporter ATP-binding protein [Phenylobacterium sp.]|uniref:ABC transporter ATP-binding protein n=1 Tax=Phenylobacterium sp. TaxID=1871053 RepID=UPI002B45B3A5|nr:ABC transporter ATP-binding protein [Phenylobacterium sp.]HKR86555.1 ABC transporter ATP-binding protein [Phenylobacterium sp.]
MTQLLAHDLAVRLGGRRLFARLGASFEPGRVSCIVGPNGAGKSTLMACLAGLRRPDAGEVRLGDAAILKLAAAARARRIGFLPQTPEIAWPIEVETLVGLGRIPHHSSGSSPADRAAIAAAMQATAVAEFAGRRVDSLSGGERARVLIARALAGEPEWLLADEPLTGLDPGHQMDACGLFRRLAHQAGLGVVLTLHDLPLALRLADRILVLAEGALIASGAPAETLTPEIIRRAYGVDARLVAGHGGPLLELIGRHAA